VNPGKVTIAASLLPYLREGVKREWSAALTVLAIELDTDVDPDSYYKALARFDAARTLFEAVVASEAPEPVDLVLDLARWPRLVLRVLELEYDAEVRRLQDAAAEGFQLPAREIPALQRLVVDIREKVGAPPRPKQPSLLKRQLAQRRRRSRG
jgi:hypothetical protein